MFRPPPNPHHDISAAKPKQLPFTFDLRKKKKRKKKSRKEKETKIGDWYLGGFVSLK